MRLLACASTMREGVAAQCDLPRELTVVVPGPGKGGLRFGSDTVGPLDQSRVLELEDPQRPDEVALPDGVRAPPLVGPIRIETLCSLLSHRLGEPEAHHAVAYLDTTQQSRIEQHRRR